MNPNLFSNKKYCIDCKKVSFGLLLENGIIKVNCCGALLDADLKRAVS